LLHAAYDHKIPNDKIPKNIIGRYTHYSHYGVRKIVKSPADPSQILGYRVRTILPFADGCSRLDNGLLWTGNGRILSIGPFNQIKNAFSAPIQDLGEQAMVPGLINAHTHLELSHLDHKTPQGQGFLPWVQGLIKLPLKNPDPEYIRQAIALMLAQGVAGLGDISGHSQKLMHRIHSQLPIPSRLFVEFLGFHSPPHPCWPLTGAPETERLSASGHALYSTRPELLQEVKNWTTLHQRPFCMHLAEHIGEVDLLTTGRGEFAEFLRGRLFPSSYRPPGQSPVAYAHHLGLLDKNTLAVHCVHINEQEIQLLAQKMVHVCLCPRSNAYINCGRPPAESLHAAGVRMSLGTDGLSSNFDLNLWHEAAYLAGIWQGNLSLTDLIAMITINPAQALGLDRVAGSLQPGKIDRFSLVPKDLQAVMPV
jgi:cytosine/adenosine deaminase-related metal-dependent hydrolase